MGVLVSQSVSESVNKSPDGGGWNSGEGGSPSLAGSLCTWTRGHVMIMVIHAQATSNHRDKERR